MSDFDVSHPAAGRPARLTSDPPECLQRHAPQHLVARHLRHLCHVGAARGRASARAQPTGHGAPILRRSVHGRWPTVVRESAAVGSQLRSSRSSRLPARARHAHQAETSSSPSLAHPAPEAETHLGQLCQTWADSLNVARWTTELRPNWTTRVHVWRSRGTR
jgi:hypothetical protein